jgi:adenylate kinase
VLNSRRQDQPTALNLAKEKPKLSFYVLRLERKVRLADDQRVGQNKFLIRSRSVMSAKNDRAGWIKGGDARCAVPPRKQQKARHLVLLGAPGVGKGTQAELLCERLGTCQLSTGDIFRAAKNLGGAELSPALEAALDFMRRGELVPDTTVLDLVRERVSCLRCAGGFLLDGFPRTVAQAQALDELLREEGIRLDAVLNYDLPIEQIVSRLSGRRTCPGCKAVFHITGRPPRHAGVCDHCGGELVQREDDRPETVRLRMEVYEKNTSPLTDYYRERGLLETISATGTPEAICGRTIAALDRSRARVTLP